MNELARCTVTWEGTTAVVTLGGEIDMSNAATLEQELLAECATAEAIVIDLGGLDYLDSAGTRTLHRLAALTRAERRGLRLVAPPSSITRRVLDVVGMAETVPIADDLPTALSPAATQPGLDQQARPQDGSRKVE